MNSRHVFTDTAPLSLELNPPPPARRQPDASLERPWGPMSSYQQEESGVRPGRPWRHSRRFLEE